MKHLLTLTLLCVANLLHAQSIDSQEILRRGNSVQTIAPGQYAQSTELAALAPPTDDRHKWFITLITQPNCAPCKQLLADLQNAPELKAWVNLSDATHSWSHFNQYNSEDATQQWRWANIAIKGYPTLLVQPPRSGKYGDPAIVVMQKTGYNGKPAELAEQLRASILKQVAERQPPVATPHQATTAETAWENRPSAPTVAPPFTPPPVVEPSDNVLSPNVIPPTVDPDATPPKDEKSPAKGLFPQHPEAVIVVDKFAENMSSETGFDKIRAVIQRLQRERPGLTVRLLDIRDASQYPVNKQELPAVITTSEGRIETKLDRTLLPILANDPPPFPWQALVTLLTSGFNWAGLAAIGFWCLIMLRRWRQARGKQLLLDDEQTGRLRELLEKLLGRETAAK
jgi:hypothetical protein